MQYEIQQLLVESNGIPEQEKRRVVSAHKSEYQHAVILDNQNKRKRERQAQGKESKGTSKGTPSRKRKLSFRSCFKYFQSQIEQGTYYICVICNRTFYKKSVRIFKNNENDLTKYPATNILSYDNKKYICMTCNKKTKKNKIPCQAVYNKLEISDVPQELKSLNKLEIALISQRLLFKKLAIMAKGQMPKIRGAICNIAVDVRDICNSLPRNSRSSGIILVKLTKKNSIQWTCLFSTSLYTKGFRCPYLLQK